METLTCQDDLRGFFSCQELRHPHPSQAEATVGLRRVVSGPAPAPPTPGATLNLLSVKCDSRDGGEKDWKERKGEAGLPRRTND